MPADLGIHRADPETAQKDDGSHQRWTVVFVLKDMPSESERADLIQRVPLRAGFVTTETSRLLVLRATGDQSEALAEAATALRHWEAGSEGALQYSEIRMINHETAKGQIETSQPIEFIGITECASELGISRQRVRQLVAENKLPDPDACLGKRPLWAAGSFRKFAEYRSALLKNTPVGHDPDWSIWHFDPKRSGAD